MNNNIPEQRRIQRRRTKPPPPFEICSGCIFFENFDSMTFTNFIVFNMQCLLYVFNFLLSLQKHRVCVKEHAMMIKTIFSPQTVYRAGTVPPGSEIPASATYKKCKLYVDQNAMYCSENMLRASSL